MRKPMEMVQRRVYTVELDLLQYLLSQFEKYFYGQGQRKIKGVISSNLENSFFQKGINIIKKTFEIFSKMRISLYFDMVA